MVLSRDLNAVRRYHEAASSTRQPQILQETSSAVQSKPAWLSWRHAFGPLTDLKAATSSFGAAVAVCALLQPLDLIKTRMQVLPLSNGAVPPYTSTRVAIRQIYDVEGVRGLYKGLNATMIASGLSWGIFRYFFDVTRYSMMTGLSEKGLVGDVSKPDVKFQCNLAAGVVAGLATTTLVHPLWLVKTRLEMQAYETQAAGWPQYRGWWHCIESTWKSHGLWGLYRGFGPALGLVPHAALQILVYEELKKWDTRRRKQECADSYHTIQHLLPASLRPFTWGATSKLVAICATYPLQVLRARQQMVGSPIASQNFVQVAVRAIGRCTKDSGRISSEHLSSHLSAGPVGAGVAPASVILYRRAMIDTGQQAFYSGGTSDALNSRGSLATSIPNNTTAQANVFRQVFRHFLLNFSVHGECIYKNQIRQLELRHWKQSPESAPDVAHSRNVPSMCLDLEHLNMPHWLPDHEAQQTASQSILFEDTASQMSEEDPAGEVRIGRSTWGELLVNSFRQYPLRSLGLAEQVIRELYIEMLSAKDRAEYFQNRRQSVAIGEALGVSGMTSINDEGSSMPTDETSTIDTKRLALFQLELISRHLPTRVRDLTASTVESLIVVPGIVVQAYRPHHKAVRVKIRCKQCDSEQLISVPLWRQSAEIPRFCSVGGSRPEEERCPVDPYVILSDESEFCDVQTIKMQELPEHVPTGDMPRHVVLNAANALCGRVVPGERVLVVGVFSTVQKAGETGKTSSGYDDATRMAYIHVLGLEFLDRTGPRKAMLPSFSQEKEYQAMARDPDIHQKIFKSIAPALFGLDDIKKSIACLLFGGSRKSLADGTRLRGDINILLLGDPSTAKSQFLKFVEKAAPIAVYTSGKGSSAAGLTAAVIRDSNRNFALEGGAMVLADGGVVCIDEFDKMRDDDRVSIHEAMEQQTISIAKAGITTVLTTRCSVLAAANPSFGSYDDSKETTDQHDFETTILSRFDLIWLVRDVKDAERDQCVARHILQLHLGAGQSAPTEGPIPTEKLREYINYCRSACNPILSSDAAKKLENYYVEVRDSMRRDGRKQRDQIPITIRQLESLSRIAESLARMSLSRFVTTAHVEEAIHLFNLATLEAAKSSLARETLSEAEKEKVRAAETAILQRLPVNGRASKASILRELKLKGFENAYTARALVALIHRGLLEERGDASVKRIAAVA